jgi:hypothetical protein
MRWLVPLLVVAACGGGDDYQVYQPPAIDAAVACGLSTCESHHATCGPVGDGCSMLLQCGSCGDGQVCGSADMPFTCVTNPCIPRTCSDAFATCGKVDDGCGGLTESCGDCTVAGDTCGGGGVPNLCGQPPCEGLCQQQMACATQTTTITGKVTAPGHDDVATWGTPDPIYGAVVYVPNGPPPSYGVTAFTPGVACETCSGVSTGSPLVLATTGVDGTFKLENAPCGTNIPLVIQLDRWRRQIVIPSVACCATTALTGKQTHLPRTRTGEVGDVRSDIPQMAVSTGSADPMHCVLRKIGIADSEFTNPTAAGRVHLYQDNGAQLDASTPAASKLYGVAATLAKYDMTLFECVGERDPKASADQTRVINYANAGGRVFATHFSYVWLTDSNGSVGSNIGPVPFSKTATWLVDQSQADLVVGLVDQTLQGDPDTQARRIAFAQWLQLTGASTTLGQINITDARNDFTAVSSVPATAAATPAQRWLSTTAPFSAPLHYTFDTPVAYAPNPLPTKRCGRVLYSDFHVAQSTTGTNVFPNECVDGPLTPQEKTLEFMLFDLASCIGPPASACKPKDCEDQGITCGEAGDGCDDGVVLHCGTCTNGQTCGAVLRAACGYGSCVPLTCDAVGATCGPIGNGCGGSLECGTCTDGAVCGGGGIANQCGVQLF